MCLIWCPVLNKQDLSSAGRENFHEPNQSRGWASAFSRLCSEQVFAALLGKKESQMQIISCPEEGWSPPNVLTVVLCVKENMSSSHSAEHSCEFWAREDSAWPGQCKATKDFGMLLISGHKKCSETPQGSQTLDCRDTPHSTCSARVNLGINCKLLSPKAAVPCTYRYSKCQPPKSNGCVVTVPLWIPSLIFIQEFPSAAKHQELIHVTQDGCWHHMNKMRSLASWGSGWPVTSVFVSLSCLILQQ